MKRRVIEWVSSKYIRVTWRSSGASLRKLEESGGFEEVEKAGLRYTEACSRHVASIYETQELKIKKFKKKIKLH